MQSSTCKLFIHSCLFRLTAQFGLLLTCLHLSEDLEKLVEGQLSRPIEVDSFVLEQIPLNIERTSALSLHTPNKIKGSYNYSTLILELPSSSSDSKYICNFLIIQSGKLSISDLPLRLSHCRCQKLQLCIMFEYVWILRLTKDIVLIILLILSYYQYKFKDRQATMDLEKLPFYIFLIIRPDGNTAFSRIHQQYPLELDINQLLTLGSNLNNLNTLQKQIIYPDIKNNRKDQLDLTKNSSIKSINASTFQMRFLDTISGYMFIISAGNTFDHKKLDNKLENIYKCFVDYIIKAPFFNSTEKVDNPIFVKKSNQILYSN